MKLVKGTPQQAIKNLLGVFYINQDNYRHGLVTFPKFIHQSDDFHQLKFSSQNYWWEFRTNNLTILTISKNLFDTDHWRTHNGSKALHFENKKYTLQFIAF